MRSSGVLTLIFALCLLAACGGHSSNQARSLLPASSSSAAQSEDPYQQALNLLPADIRAEVDALVPPAGCNAKVFYALKKSFVLAMASNLASGGKIVCTPPTGDGNKAAGLTITPSGGDFILRWNYRNIGDYDQSGTVGITDITPIAMHYGHTVGTDPLDAVIDGDGSGTIGIADVTPLAMYFGINVTSYRVESSATETGTYTELGTVLFTTGTGADQGWKRLEFTLPNGNNRWLRVVPLDGQGIPGVPSDALEFSGTAPPVVSSVSPLSGAINASVQFSAVVSGVGPFTYSWSFGAAASPSTSSAAQPTVTLAGAAGGHDCSLTVSNGAGSDTFDFVFLIGEPPLVSSVAPSGGVTGTEVQFSATATGTPPMTYAWDFGGGASPNSSVNESPTVTLGALGAYNASVTVTNAYGESFLGYVIIVTGLPEPPEIYGVNPVAGLEYSEVTVSAMVTGTPTFSYSWNFGGAATPSTYNVPVPTIRLNGEGVYPCTLTVDNAHGSDYYDFNFTVTASPAYDEVEDNDDLAGANQLVFPLAGFRGHCGAGGYDGDGDDYFTFDAEVDDVILLTMEGTDDSYDLDVNLLDANGGFLADSTNIGPNEFLSYVFTPSDVGPFYIHVYVYSEAGEYEMNGTLGPIIPWNKNVVDDTTSGYLGFFSAMTFTGGRPGCFYQCFDEGDVYFAYSDDETGMGAWKTYPVDVGLSWSGDYLNAGVIGDKPAVAHYDDESSVIEFAMCTTADGSGAWNNSEIAVDSWYDPSIAEVDGRPAVAFGRSDDRLCFAINSSSDGSGTWNVYNVTPTAIGAYYTSLMTLADGRPAIAFNSHIHSTVSFAVCSTVDGSGVWSVSTLANSSAYPSSSAALIDGRPAVVTMQNDDYPYYYINSEPDGSGAWSSYRISSVKTDTYISLELIDGKPTVLFEDSSNNIYLARGIADDGAGVWSYQLVFREGRLRSNSVLGWVNSKPALVFMHATGYWVGFATPPSWP